MKQVQIDILEQDVEYETVNRSRKTFGISVKIEKEDGQITSELYPDISYSRLKVEKFISMLMRNDVSPVHIDEMIDDYFYSA